MIKVYLNVEGMMCSMCEAHVNDAVRKIAKVKKVKSNHKKNLTIIVMEEEKDIDNILNAIKALGYNCSLDRIENN